MKQKKFIFDNNIGFHNDIGLVYFITNVLCSQQGSKVINTQGWQAWDEANCNNCTMNIIVNILS